MNELQIAKEVLLSVIKWFLIFVAINNLMWVLIVLSSNATDITNDMKQYEGSNNIQELTNG